MKQNLLNKKFKNFFKNVVHLLNFSALKVRDKFQVFEFQVFDSVCKTKKYNFGVCCKKVFIYPVVRNCGIKSERRKYEKAVLQSYQHFSPWHKGALIYHKTSLAVCALCEASRSPKNDMEVITTAAYAMKDYEIEMLAKSFLPEIRAFFESEEGRAEYEKQVAEQKIKNITQTA